MSEHLIYCIEAITKNTGNPTGLFIGYCGEKVSRMATYDRAFKFHDEKTAGVFKVIFFGWAKVKLPSQIDFKVTEHEEITEVIT